MNFLETSTFNVGFKQLGFCGKYFYLLNHLDSPWGIFEHERILNYKSSLANYTDSNKEEMTAVLELVTERQKLLNVLLCPKDNRPYKPEWTSGSTGLWSTIVPQLWELAYSNSRCFIIVNLFCLN